MGTSSKPLSRTAGEGADLRITVPGQAGEGDTRHNLTCPAYRLGPLPLSRCEVVK
jgi:hypothetical protein